MQTMIQFGVYSEKELILPFGKPIALEGRQAEVIAGILKPIEKSLPEGHWVGYDYVKKEGVK